MTEESEEDCQDQDDADPERSDHDGRDLASLNFQFRQSTLQLSALLFFLPILVVIAIMHSHASHFAIFKMRVVYMDLRLLSGKCGPEAPKST
jgi:hypothetical protein